jgi:hypothetical protein
MRRFITVTAVVCLLGLSPVVSGQQREDGPGRDPGSAIARILRQAIKHLLPATLGDWLSPPHP